MLKGAYLPLEAILRISVNLHNNPQLIGSYLAPLDDWVQGYLISKVCFHFGVLDKTWYLCIWNLADQGHMAVLCFFFFFAFSSRNMEASKSLACRVTGVYIWLSQPLLSCLHKACCWAFLINRMLTAHSGLHPGWKDYVLKCCFIPHICFFSDMSMYLSSQEPAPARGNWLTAGLRWLLVTTLPAHFVILPSNLTVASFA